MIIFITLQKYIHHLLGRISAPIQILNPKFGTNGKIQIGRLVKV